MPTRVGEATGEADSASDWMDAGKAGVMSANDQAGGAKEPSGYNGDASTAGPGKTDVKSETPENKEGHLNPSAPEEANVTPGSAGTK